METLQATIDNVFVKQLNDGRSLFRVMVGEREYTTLKKSLAEQAKDLVDREAVIGFNVKQNGNFTNYYLESVQASNGQLAINGNGPAPVSEERELRIMRQSALERALLSLPYFTAAEQTRETIATLCEEYLAYFVTGEWGGDTMTAANPDLDDIPF